MKTAICATFMVACVSTPVFAQSPSDFPGYGNTNFFGNVSPSKITATGSTTARSLADRAADVANVRDQGADNTGSSDSASAFTSAASRAISAGTEVFVGPGIYNLLSGVGSSTQTWEFQNARLKAGSAGLTGVPDLSALEAPLAHAWLRTGTDTGNSYTTYTTLEIPSATGASADYEKAAGYDNVSTNDPSTSHNLDAVGRVMTCSILGTNALGRCWGWNVYSRIVSGGDGSLVGGEIDVENNGSDQSQDQTTTTKTGLGIFNLGSVKATVGIKIGLGQSPAAGFHTGIQIYSGAATDYAFRLMSGTSATTELAHIDASGNIATTGTIKSAVLTVATLPTCNTAAKGTNAAVSDASAPTFLGTVSGGGSTYTPVTCNGTNWVAY